MKARNIPNSTSDNTTSIIERMQSSFPHIYNVHDKNTILYALLSIFGSKYGMRTDIIDRLYAMIGIDSTYDEDLEHRWGSLLGVYKQAGESFSDYRDRLRIIYSSLSGGTAEAIKYAIASAAGIDSDDNIDDYIHVYDAWEYPYTIDPSLLGISKVEDESSLYGSIICSVDISGANNIVEHDRIMNAINRIKASGINPCLLLLYNANEYVSLLRDADTISDSSKYLPDDHIGIRANDEDTYTVSMDTVHDVCAINGLNMGIWSDFGTNSAVLNGSLITNMYVEPDECVDIIRYNSDKSAVLGVGILGEAVLGTK